MSDWLAPAGGGRGKIWGKMNALSDHIGNALGVAMALGIAIWVFLDAKAIGDDKGRTPGLVNTKPGAWAAGVYLLMRVRYTRLLAVRQLEIASRPAQTAEDDSEAPGVWPPPPSRPAA